MAAHTIVAGATSADKVTGRKADAVLAAYWAGQAALRLLKPGKNNYAVTEAVNKVADSYKCKAIEGMLSHQLKQGKIDGEKTIIQNPNEPQRKEHEKCDFEMHEVYAIDVLVSSGEGVGREKDTKVAIYKKTDENYQLKLKASRALLTEVGSRFAMCGWGTLSSSRVCHVDVKIRARGFDCNRIRNALEIFGQIVVFMASGFSVSLRF